MSEQIRDASLQDPKKVEREALVNELGQKIEAARKAGLINNEVANLVTYALKLEGDEALFANRVIARGSDPASLEFALQGEISEPVMRAHTQGPGALKEHERDAWLLLAHASIDEHANAKLSPSKKFAQFHDALKWLETASEEERKEAIDHEFQKIIATPFEIAEVRGVSMRVYTSDLGFASAYWNGCEFAAVKEDQLTFVGSQNRTLQEIGIQVDKQLSPTFGIIF